MLRDLLRKSLLRKKEFLYQKFNEILIHSKERETRAFNIVVRYAL